MASRQQKGPLSPAGEPQQSWQQRFEERWKLCRRGVPLPKHPDWKALYALKPFERNLLQNSNPEGVNVSEPAPPCPPNTQRMPLDCQDNFKGWQISIEPIPAAADSKEDPQGLVSPSYSWRVKEQCIDLLAEGLWEELLDSYQPDITIMDWYENSKLANCVYELYVRLLGTDGALVIAEFHHVACGNGQDGKNKNWNHVSHVFKRYGPGVRHVHFLQKTKEAETATGLLWTRATDSSVSVQLRD